MTTTHLLIALDRSWPSEPAIGHDLPVACGYNLAALPLAAIGLSSPLATGAAVTISPAGVVADSLELRRFQSPPTHDAARGATEAWARR